MWLVLLRLFVVRFKGQVAVWNYAPSRDAAAAPAWVSSLKPHHHHHPEARRRPTVPLMTSVTFEVNTFSLATSGTIMFLMTDEILLPAGVRGCVSVHRIIYVKDKVRTQSDPQMNTLILWFASCAHDPLCKVALIKKSLKKMKEKRK